ncbi:MAG: biotin/lipoyl-binding protein [Deltaproteobacteria bacterium]|nr:biotin/lipoyl-binding protein [Deltaproteobacteria bacterium]
MAFDFKFPDVGEGIQEGTLVKWRVKEGDTVKEDDVLADVETDKAVVEIPSPKSGKITKRHVGENQIIKVGSVMVTIE